MRPGMVLLAQEGMCASHNTEKPLYPGPEALPAAMILCRCPLPCEFQKAFLEAHIKSIFSMQVPISEPKMADLPERKRPADLRVGQDLQLFLLD
jgi:hypothetical protein